jgi:hypothetical protein
MPGRGFTAEGDGRAWRRAIELFVIWVGDRSGCILAVCDDSATVRTFRSMLPGFEFKAQPLNLIEDAAFTPGAESIWSVAIY